MVFTFMLYLEVMSEMFSARLKELRKSRGLTQEQLAAIIGVERSSVGKYESRPIIPSSEILNKLADYFGVSVDYLLGRADIKKAPAEAEAAKDEKDIEKILAQAREHLMSAEGLRVTAAMGAMDALLADLFLPERRC